MREIFKKEKMERRLHPYFFRKKSEGQAALSLVLLVGGTVVLIAATLFFLVISFINTTYGFQAANKAWGLAISGLNDGVLQLTRNATLPSQTYEFETDDTDVNVEIKRGCVWDGSSIDCRITDNSGIKYGNQAVVYSDAAVSGRTKRVYMFVSVGLDGRVEIISIGEETGGAPI